MFLLLLLDAVQIESIFDFLSNYSFNALRIPLSVDLVLNDPLAKFAFPSPNQQLVGKTGLQILDVVVEMAAEAGILILLDMHRLQASQESPPLWYSHNYTGIWKINKKFYPQLFSTTIIIIIIIFNNNNNKE